MRTALVEAVWRLMRLQPDWWRWAKLRQKLAAESGRWVTSKKKIAVVLARGLAVDLWRLNTGRCKLDDLGLTPALDEEDVETARPQSAG